MATPVSTIPHSTVIWFGSLGFMSTGFGYDMILLSIRGPGGARIMLTRSKAPRRPHHHASPPKKKRGQHRHRHTAAARAPPRKRRAAEHEPAAPRAKATSTTSQCQDNRTTKSDGITPHPPSPRLHYYHTVCSPPGGHTCSAWTTRSRHSPIRYAQVPRRTWSDHWSSRAMSRRSRKHSQRPSSHIFHGYVGSDA